MWDWIKAWWDWNMGNCVIDPMGNGDTRPACY